MCLLTDCECGLVTVREMDAMAEASTSQPTVADDETTEEVLSPEMLQRKLYFLLEHLKKMHSELPE